MSKNPCSICSKKTQKQCGICEAYSCPTCSDTLESNFFRYLEDCPEELTHNYYCHSCYVEHVEPAFHAYNEILERAKEMQVYFKKKHSKLVRLFKKAQKSISVVDSPDYDDMILHLAFLSAKLGFNTIINVETSSRKVHNGSYKTILHSGTATPATKG